MTCKKNYSLFVLFLLFLILSSVPLYGDNYKGQMNKTIKGGGSEEPSSYTPMPDPGKKVSIGGGYYLMYGFDKKPKMGTVIVKVEIFNAEGKKDTSFEVKADSGMPSMRGAHESGEQSFAISKKGDYLLPINIVMPGDWEIRLKIIKDGKTLLRGRYNFNV
jgi:hypothetical protein